MGPPDPAVPRACILPHAWPRARDAVLGASALCAGVPQTHPSWKVASFLGGWQGEETSSMSTTTFAINSAEITRLFFN